MQNDTFNPKDYIYLDYQATTPMDPRVFEAMVPYFNIHFGNPHSRNHIYGWNAEEAMEISRQQIAKAIGANEKEIIFTSGATESNNLAIKGLAEFYGDKKRHIITLTTEHKCILETCRYLEGKGFDVTYLPVLSSGLVDMELLEKMLRDDTLLVSIMAVNNEIGVIQPLEKIGKMCRERGIFFHTDAAQAFGKIPLDVKAMNIDLLSISGHKIYGPKGIGALYVGKQPRVRLKAQIHGGGQERGMRSGTMPTPLCVGLGKAAQIALEDMEKDDARILQLRNYLYEKIKNNLESITLNGDLDARISGNLNISFAGVEGEGAMAGVKHLCISSGSACTSASLEPSYVLRALGVDEEMAHSSLRIGIGRFTTREEIERCATMIIEAITRLRNMSPLWEMMKDGIDLKSIQWSEH
jgi:cysteine desulfurase